MTKVGWYTIGTSTTLESNKSLDAKPWEAQHGPAPASAGS